MDTIRPQSAHSSNDREQTVEQELPAPSPAAPQDPAWQRRRVLQLVGVAAVSLAGIALAGDDPGEAARKEKRKRRNKRRRRRTRRQDDAPQAPGGGGGGGGGGNGRGNDDPGTILFQDDFQSGFTGAGADWSYFSSPGFTGNNGEETTSSDGLLVSQPQFTSTVPLETGLTSLPGGFDHVKWLVFISRLNGAAPGFAAQRGSELSVTARMSARTFGTTSHPFGNAVTDPEADGRLAAAALNGADFETWMVFDHFLTNKRIYAIYERLPFGRPQLGNYASFTFMVPLADRQPDDEHELSVAYDRAAGTVRWLVDGDEKFRVDRIGHLADRQFMTLDHGGVEEDVEPKQLNFGMGLFTLLDGSLPNGKGLVRLSNAPDFYFDPALGAPEAQKFHDEESADGSRLFGQGAEMRVGQYTVRTRDISRGR